jgi:hypothetical protein
MKPEDVAFKMEELSQFGRLFFLGKYFLLTKFITLNFALAVLILIFISGFLFFLILGDIAGFLLFGIYLCKQGNAGSVDHWSRYKIYKTPWRIWCQKYLRSHAKSYK